MPSIIGTCDDLILDATSTTGLGGRNNAIFVWALSLEGDVDAVYNYTGDYIKVESDLLQKDVTYLVELEVTNWYTASSSASFTVYISNKATPIVSLHGVSEYSATNLNLNGFVDIFAEISFDNTCLNEEDKDLRYNIAWGVEVQKINTNDDGLEIDDNLLTKLNEYLLAQTNGEISIDAQMYLQSGAIYIFKMNLSVQVTMSAT